MSKIVVKKRRSNRTTSSLPCKAKVVRCKETIDACLAIHGGSVENPKPALEGIVMTMTTKFKSADVAMKIMSSKDSVVNQVSSICAKNLTLDYYNSEENILRSLNTYYSHDVMGKRKYLSIRKANKGATFH